MDIIKVLETITAGLDEVEFFLGGSRRFGYDTKDSDYDVFIYLPKVFTPNPEKVLKYLDSGESSSIQDFLSLLGIEDERIRIKINSQNTARGDIYVKHAFHYKTSLLSLPVDLIFFSGNKERYLEYKEEHQAVENFLKDNSILIDVYKNLQAKGGYKYKALLKAMKSRSDKTNVEN